jgi:diguanylate cyclase (GGDEF)-like protein
MVQEEKLSAVLSEFARTLVTDFPIQSILDHLVRRISDILPITSAGVTLITPGAKPRYIAASDSSALRYEALQTEVGEGPCLLAYQSGEAVAVADIGADDRFPAFGPRAATAGLAAVFAFPLWQEGSRMGALDLYRDSPGGLSAGDLVAAQTLADVAAAYLTNVQARADARELSEQYRQSASHDLLTGLPNRLLLSQRIEHAAQRGKRSQTSAAVLFADLDGFKSVNDTHGHQTGDGLLVAVSQRLAALLRPGDTLARVSGDEFVILCEDLHDSGDVELLANRIDEAFEVPFLIADVEVSITASVGIAFAGTGSELSEQLVKDADTAMYQAKRKGGASHQIVDLREINRENAWRDLERDLRDAVTHRRFEVRYQPIVRCTDGGLSGVETRLYWNHATLGDVAPETVLDLAEQTGLIEELGGWLLDRACRDRQQWLEFHPVEQLEMTVQVSTVQLLIPGFCDAVARILAETQTPPAALILALTEDVYLADAELAGAALRDLKQLGVRMAMSDFGTGNSSLKNLRRFPLEILEIDASFLDGITDDPADSLVIVAITGLAHSLGLRVVAKGVETARQREVAGTVGCDGCQGLYFADPMISAAVANLLRDADALPISLPLPE